MKKWMLFWVCCISALGAQATISLSNEVASVGLTTTIRCSDPVNELVVEYRPGSTIVDTVLLSSPTPTTSFDWTPEKAGVVALSYSDASGNRVSKNVSVRFAGLSLSGILVMMAAGTVLFGGATVAFRTLFTDADEDGVLDFNPEQLPDT
ncbi:MAG: hypothetical protein AAF598_22560 [Bacteroidota bacterium]